MVEILKSRHLWGYVGGMGTPPAIIPRPADLADLAIWEEADQTACTLLQLSVKSTHIGVFQGATTAAEYWQQTKEVYDSRDLMLQTYVLKQFVGLKMTEANSVDKHILEFRNWKGKLISVGFALEEDLVAVILLSTMHETWTGVVQSLQEVQNLTVNRVIAAMLTEESRKHIATVSVNSDKTLYTNKPFRGRGRGRPFVRGGRGGRGG